MKSGEIEDWHKSHRLALRTELGTGTVKIDGKEIEFSISLNIDNKAFFVEFPESVKVTYHTSDMIEDAIALYEEYLRKSMVVQNEG